MFFHFEKLFVDRLSRPLEMLFEGEALYTITGKALRKDFTLELSSSEIIGKAEIGGKPLPLVERKSERKELLDCTTDRQIDQPTD